MLSLLLFPLLALADATYVSPDGKYVAKVQALKNAEIYVTMETKAGQGLASVNLMSQDAEHGRTLGKAAWSADSRFFVFTTQSSGGHSPWHDTAFYYSATAETFRNFDERSGLSTAALDFAIDAADVLKFQKYNFEKGVAEPAQISLLRLEAVRH